MPETMLRSSLFGTSFLVASTVVVVACSSGSSSGSSSAGGACAEYVAAQREGAQACGKYIVAPGREAELSARLEKECTLVSSAPGSGITPTALVACAAKMRAACGDDDACEDILVAGTLADGAACGADTQCASGDCKSSSTTANRCGVCVARVAIGGACGGADAGNCVKGASCATKGGTTGTCVARTVLAEGDVCFDPAKPASAPASCGEGLVCNQDGSNTSTVVKCTKRGGAGSSCISESDCLEALTCLNATCGSPGPIGTSCTTSSQCANAVCSSDTKKCVAVEWVAAGGACDSIVRRCTRGSCSQSGSGPGTCIDPLPDGAACTVDSSATAARCDRYASCVNGTCQIFDPTTTCK
jgi:hypothetical protein